MKKFTSLLLSLSILSGVASAQDLIKEVNVINTYQIQITDLNKTFVRKFDVTVNPKNIIASDFENGLAVSYNTNCNGVITGHAIPEMVAGLFSSSPGSQQLAISFNKVLNIKEIESVSCRTVEPIIDNASAALGFPFISLEQTVKTDKNTYLIVAKRIK